ncbi:MAG: COG4280 domain-containing protein [Ktedonobacterales bacterium]
MTGQLWAVLIAAFLASTVEFVEAFTIVLVVGVTVNWRSAWVGTAAAAGALAVLVAIFGTAIVKFIPLEALRFAIGLLLVLFGLKWLKKAILRYAGLKATHDEEAIYEEKLAAMKAHGEAPPTRVDPFGVVTSFKSVLLEGLEVAFIVITFGVQADQGGQTKGIFIAALGAAAACLLVVSLGAVVRAPLQRIPENTLKYVVGVMLTSFGTFWGGEGLGILWWHEDLTLPLLVLFYLAVTGLLVLLLKPYAPVKAQLQPQSGGAVEKPLQKEVLG